MAMTILAVTNRNLESINFPSTMPGGGDDKRDHHQKTNYHLKQGVKYLKQEEPGQKIHPICY